MVQIHKLLAKRHLIFLILILAFSAAACRAEAGVDPTSSPVPSTPTATGVVTSPPVEPQTPSSAPTLEPFSCGFQQETAALLENTTQETWLDWIEKLSGAEPVVIDGKETTIKTRFTISMFDGNPNARAFDFVHQQVLNWYPPDQVEVMDYDAVAKRDKQEFPFHGKNLILTIPGTSLADEVVVLSAHLDSISKNPTVLAPGAEDNGSGSAALLEAARLFRDRSFERTVKIIWFTGEELGLHGSRHYVEQLTDPLSIVGVVNLDMFGYDSDNDRCFEMHVGVLPASERVGQCFIHVIKAYDLDLPRYDYLTGKATSRSDHGSFWAREIGAIEILENMLDQNLTTQGQQNACQNGDPNKDYHTDNDTVDRINPETGIQIVRAGIATVAVIAGLLP